MDRGANAVRWRELARRVNVMRLQLDALNLTELGKARSQRANEITFSTGRFQHAPPFIIVADEKVGDGFGQLVGRLKIA